MAINISHMRFGMCMLILCHPGSFDQRFSGEKFSYHFYTLIPNIFHETVGLFHTVLKVQGRRFAMRLMNDEMLCVIANENTEISYSSNTTRAIKKQEIT